MAKSKKQKQKDWLKKAEKERERQRERIEPYLKYKRLFNEYKEKGWEFKEGAQDLLSKEAYEAAERFYGERIDETGLDFSEFFAREQLNIQDESIDQAVGLWNANSNLVEEYGKVDYNKWRGNEKEYFRILRSQFDDDESYDLAMSY